MLRRAYGLALPTILGSFAQKERLACHNCALPPPCRVHQAVVHHTLAWQGMDEGAATMPGFPQEQRCDCWSTLVHVFKRSSAGVQMEHCRPLIELGARTGFAVLLAGLARGG